jgi:hypothetical protein
MAFTRYHDDPHRISKYLEETTFAGNYSLNTPGAGLQLPFFEEPQMRLQKWGANLMTDTTNLESDLFGLGRKLNHDFDRTYKQDNISNSREMIFVSSQPFVEESRATHPAWMYKDLEHSRWEVPILNPQANLEKGFHENIQTRILEKDYFKPVIPNVIEREHDYEYAQNPLDSVFCSGKQSCSFINSQKYV